MTAAVLAGLAVWLLVPQPGRRRSRQLWRPSSASGRRLDPTWLAAAMAPVLGLVLLGWPTGLVVGLLAAPIARTAVGRLESGADRARSEAAHRQLPPALDLVSACLEAGRPPGLALKLAGEATPDPLGADLSALAHRVSVAGDLSTALQDVAGPLRALARALRRAEQSGIPISDVVVAVAGDVNRERVARRREAARRVGVRTAAPLGICFMPSFLLIGVVPTIVATASTIGPAIGW